ncbi:MAG: lipoprotein-releasing ABC transporter permease subunit [Gammaproteobacteria bacterium]
MFKENISLFIALKYLRAKRKGFLSFVSSMAFTCVALGVAVLIIVTSVMNGFERELKDRILNVIPHAQIIGLNSISNWKEIKKKAEENPNVIGAAPYIETQVLVGSSNEVYGSNLLGIDPELERQVSVVSEFLIQGSFESLEANSNNIVLGEILARKLNLDLGDKVSLMLPDKNPSFAGYFPRISNFKVSGIFRVGSADLDESIAYINIDEAASLLSLNENVHGLRLKFDDLFQANYLAWDVLINAETVTEDILTVQDWTYSYGPLFKAILQERVLVGLLLSLIILVAAFNIIAMLVMMINEKKSQIAIFKTMGMSRKEIRNIFLYLGIMISFIGTIIGTFFGLLITLFLSTSFMESIMSSLMRGSYFINYFPIDIRFSIIYMIIIGTLIVTMSVCLYPAKLASALIPADVLRNE